MPTADIFEAPSQEDLKRGVRFIKEFSKYLDLLGTKEPKPSIYVHCKSGKMRSATMVACYLMEVSVILEFKTTEISTSHYSQI